MSDSQYKGTIRQSFAWWDVKGADLPIGLFQDFDEKFKAWEKRRGFKNDEEKNPDDPEPVKPLRGNALRNKLARESKEKMLAKEAAKVAKKNEKKGLQDPRKNTKFSPPIVGKRYHSDNNAKRAIKHFISVHYLTIPEDYVFGVNKIDWGVYEVTGTRKQTKQPSKKNENSN